MRRRVLLCMTLISMSACRGDDATRPNLDPASPPSQSISDGNHQGNPEFFFLPPLVKDPSGSADWSPGTFNGSLTPTIDICELDAIEAIDEPKDRNVKPDTPCKSSPPGYAAKYQLSSANVSLTDEHYHLNWGVPSSAAVYFRIAVSVGSVKLGFIDVKTASTSSQLKNVNTGELVPLKDGRTVPIKFRIEKNALCYTPENPTRTCTSKPIDFGQGGTVTNGEATPSGIDVPAQPGGQVHIVTVADCANLNPRATDLPTFDDCFQVTVDPALTAPLTNAATVFNCAVSGTVGDVYSSAQARRLTMLQFNEQVTPPKLKALPHAEPTCPPSTASAAPSVRAVLAELTHGRVKSAAKQMLAVLAPRPLYAARFIDLGGGGFTHLGEDAGSGGLNSVGTVGGARFSQSAASPATTVRDFQLALPAKFEVSATPTDRSELPGATITVSVKVTDLGGEPVRNARVRFQPSAGSSVNAAVIEATGIDGLATVQWTLSDTPGKNTLVASGHGIAGPDVNGPREGTDPFQPLHTEWGDLTDATEPFVVSTGSMTVTANTGQCTNDSATDCNPAGATLNTGAAFVDPAPPAGYKQCAGFINTVSDDVRWDWENNCIPFKGGPLFVRVFDDATGQIIAGARVYNGVVLFPSWSSDGFNYSADAFEGEGLLDNPSASQGLPGGVSLAWHASDRSYCGCGRPGGGTGSCNDIFTANSSDSKVLYVGGNSSNHNYEAVYGPPGRKNTCSLNSEIVRLRIAIYASTLSSSPLRIPSQPTMSRIGSPLKAPARSSADVCSSFQPDTEHATQRPPECP